MVPTPECLPPDVQSCFAPRALPPSRAPPLRKATASRTRTRTLTLTLTLTKTLTLTLNPKP